MKILRDETRPDLNTPEWFNHVWNVEGIHCYDSVRLREFLKPMDETKRLLDVGAGWMGTAQYAVNHGYPGKYMAIDFSTEARRRTLEITPQLDYRIGDALNLPFTAEFDVVACGELIEHFRNPQPLVDELVRVCKPGGFVLISTVNALCDAAVAHGEYPEHMILWDTKEELLPHFEPHGRTRVWEVGDYFMLECKKS